MPKTPRSPIDDEGKNEPCPESGDKSAWSDDQKERGYYYDDAHGYEVYEPEKDDDADEDKKPAEPGPLTT